MKIAWVALQFISNGKSDGIYLSVLEVYINAMKDQNTEDFIFITLLDQTTPVCESLVGNGAAGHSSRKNPMSHGEY